MVEKMFKKSNQKLVKKIFASIMLPMFIFQMSSLNLLLASPAMAITADDPNCSDSSFTVVVKHNDGNKCFKTIQSAINDSSTNSGDTIDVKKANYEEKVTVNKGVTISGEKDADLVGQFTISHDDVTVEGMDITNPDDGYGVIATDVSHLTFKNNVIHDIGRNLDKGSAQAIIVVSSTKDVTDVHIEKNDISNIGNTNMLHNGSVGSSSKGVYLGNSGGSKTISDVTIFDNDMSKIYASTADWISGGGGGAGAYGILVNHKTSELTVNKNTIHILEGLWSHVIGLENDTPNAVVTGNKINNLKDHKTPSDVVALQLESNPSAPAITLTGNKFEGKNMTVDISTVFVDAAWASLDPDVNTFLEILNGSRYVYYGINAFSNIQDAVKAVSNGGTVNVANGTYIETGQIVIDKDLSIVGHSKTKTIIKPAQDTGNADDARGWFLVNFGKKFALKKVTLDGAEYKIFQAIRSHGSIDVQNNIIENIFYDPSTSYEGRGVATSDGFFSTISNNTFKNIGRIGIFIFGTGTEAFIKNNNYSGKGNGNWLDYGIEVGGGAQATLENNVISKNTGVADDTSTSAGILITTYWGAGTQATITGNTISKCTDGIAVGYDTADTSIVVAHKNKLGGNVNGVNSTNPLVDATNNWWGDATGPKDDISGDNSILETNSDGKGSIALGAVKYASWYEDEEMQTLTSPSAITKDATNISLYDATLNGTNGDYNATGHSIWVSLHPFSTTSPNIPSGVYSTPDFGSITANADFNAPLSLVTTQGMPAITPNTEYYYVAWSRVGNVWYPGEMKSFVTGSFLAPTLIAPENNSVIKGIPTLTNSWSSVSNAVKYEYESYHDEKMNNLRYRDTYTTTSKSADNVSNATFWWRVRAVDGAGNKSEWSPLWKVTVDNTKPNIPNNLGMRVTSLGVNIPNNSATSQSNVTAFWSSNNSEPVTYIYKAWYDNGSQYSQSNPWQNPTSATSYSGTFNQGNGMAHFCVIAVDQAGNESACSDTFNVTYDNIEPEITFSGIKYTNIKDGLEVITILDKYATNWNTPVFVGELISSDIASIKVIVNGQEYLALINGNEWTATVAGILPDGNYAMQVVATDNAGNTTQIEKELVIDTKASTAVYQYYKDGSLISDSVVYVNNVSQLSFKAEYTDTDPSSGLSTDSYVIFEAQDDGSFRFSQNGKKAYCGWRHTPNLLSLSGQTFLQTELVSFTNCVASLPDGEYYMAHQVADSATRKDIPSINQFKDVLGLHFVIDDTFPEVPAADLTANSINVSNNGYTNSKTFTFNFSSSSSDTARYQLKYWNSIPGDAFNGESHAWNPTDLHLGGHSSVLGVYNDQFTRGEGIHYFAFSACDAANNCSSYSTPFVVTYDKNAPVLSSKTNFNTIWYNSAQTSAFNYTDTNMADGYIAPTCDITSEGENQTCSVTPNICDKAGNCNTTTVISNGANIDKTLPNSTIDGGANGDTIFSNSWDGTFSGTASDSSSGVEKVELSIQRNIGGVITYWDGEGWQADAKLVLAEGTTLWTYSSLDLPLIEGEYDIESHATDKAGNTENTYKLKIIFDKTIPEINLVINPTNPNGDNEWYDSIPEISLNATDSVALDKIEYQIDSQAGTWTTYNTPVTIDEGQHIFYYRSLDKAGNYSNVGIKNVKVDTVNPDTVEGLDADYDEDRDVIKLDWRASDADIYKVHIYRGTHRSFDINSGSRIAENADNDNEITDRDISRGEKYYYKLVSIDEAGNKSDAKVISVEIPEGEGEATIIDEGTDSVAESVTEGEGDVSENQNNEGVQDNNQDGSQTDDNEENDEGRVAGAMTSQEGVSQSKQGRAWPYVGLAGAGGLLAAWHFRRRKLGMAKLIHPIN